MASPGSSTGIPRCWELRDASVRATCMGADPLGLEILLLDAGLLVTLYAMWRIVRASRAAVAAVLPWAAVAGGLYGTRIWIFLPPIQMRGLMMMPLIEVGGPP